MVIYKCIGCGEEKESEKESLCSSCGYKMYLLPYDRSEKLKEKAKEFVLAYRLPIEEVRAITFYRFAEAKNSKDNQTKGNETVSDKKILKSYDDTSRFPTCVQIEDYICSAVKTEDFSKRVLHSLEQIKQHIHSSFRQTYTADTDTVKSYLEKADTLFWGQVFPLLGIETEKAETNLPSVTLDYEEEPNLTLLPLAEDLITQLQSLVRKVVFFIRQNNMYGRVQQKPDNIPTWEKKGEIDYETFLRKSIEKTNQILAKRYVIDIFEDGSKELQEMMKTLWYGIRILMYIPTAITRYKFSFADGTVLADEKEFFKVFSDKVCVRYDSWDSFLNDGVFLQGKSEEELWEIYNKLIEIDCFGVLGVNQNGLLKIGEAEKELSRLIGLQEIKSVIQKIKAYALANKGKNDLNLHMCFLGNPGSGKTEVARIIARILYENKILPKNQVIEVDRGGLVSQYLGETAQKTMMQIQRAMGGVLFVDEAYALVPKNGSDADYGQEAVATLIKAMEDYRGKFCVILAGYKSETMQLLSVNPGFKSRIQFILDFPNYKREELRDIADLMLKKMEYTIEERALRKVLDITDIKRKDAAFSNAREVRNILDQLIMNQNLRCIGTEEREIGLIDVNKYIADEKLFIPSCEEEQRVLTGEEELDRLIGLQNVKRTVRKIKAYAKKNQNNSDFSLHMCFYGNPGTGKTEVARIVSRILYEAGVLAEAKLVETDAHGLIGQYVGETAPKTSAMIQKALNGVLFVDEAYCLDGSTQAGKISSSYGEEAISVLLKEMEDKRGKLCVIVAGYKEEMQKMLDINPGLKSRIPFYLDFPDYTREETGEIAKLFLKGKGYSIENDAFELLLDIVDYYRRQKNFANARAVRTILDKVLMNQNLRTEESEESNIVLSDVKDYLLDENIDLSQKNPPKRIGF